MPVVGPNGVSSAALCAKPTTSASSGRSPGVVSSHSSPTCAWMPEASMSMPTTLLTRPRMATGGTRSIACSSSSIRPSAAPDTASPACQRSINALPPLP